jgi:hypothetical protein
MLKIIIFILLLWLVLCIYFLFTKNNTEHFIDIGIIYKDLNGYISSKHDTYNLTYGEITLDGMNNIVKYLDDNNIRKDIFIDLGCGIGKSLIMAKMKGFKRCIGVELVKERFDNAMIAYNRLDKQDQEGIEIYNNDLFEEPRIRELDKNNSVIVFVSNLLFNQDVTNKMFTYLTDILPSNSLIIVSKRPTTDSDKLKYISTLEVPMSWMSKSICHLYKKH